MIKKWKTQYWLPILLVVVAGGGLLAFALTNGNQNGAADGVFPTMHITVPETPFEERDLRQDGTITVIDPSGAFSFEEAEAMVRGRGNSTWWDGPEKRPLRFRFQEARSMFGSEYEARNWILLANHFDRALLRNYAALHFAAQLGRMDFVPSAQHLHLYVNDEYMGVYLLTDERDVNPGRMEIEWDPDPSLSGYFVEMDGRARLNAVEGEDFIFVNYKAYDLRWPDFPDEMTPAHVDYLRQYLQAVSNAIRSESFADIIELIDLDTFVDFYLVQEFFKDPDAHITSVFMYIDGIGTERRLFMGPVWDFDIAAGNRDGMLLGHGPENLYAGALHYWFRHLLQTPEFFEATAARWEEVQATAVAETIEHLRHTAVRYQAEFERNFHRHPMMETALHIAPEDILEIDNFMEQVDHLIAWLEARAAWMSAFFNGQLPDYDPLWTLVEFYASERPIQILLDGVEQHFDIPPAIIHNKTMLALPELVSLLNLSMDHDPATGALILTRAADTITYHYGDTFMDVNGITVSFASPSAISIRGHAFFPIAYVARSLGYEVQWYDILGETLLISPP